ncbi:MAG: hypothetical protein ACHRXM_13720 [Isosphaerales bacterium]
MSLDPKRVQAVFLEAANYLDLAERGEILDRECMGETELRKRVEALLKAHDRSDEDLRFFLICHAGCGLPGLSGGAIDLDLKAGPGHSGTDLPAASRVHDDREPGPDSPHRWNSKHG